MSAVLQYLGESLSHRPYHMDDLVFDLRISDKGRAPFARYIQQSQPYAQLWLVFDVDHKGAAIDWSGRNAPASNIIVKNLVNGHVHLLYALNIAVRTVPDTPVGALRYAVTVERPLCEKLCVDVNYSGLICKNSFHPEWLVMEWREEVRTLDEPADYLDLSAPVRRSIDKYYGMGRNCHPLEMTRKWAYKAIRQGWPEFPQWLDAVIQRAEVYNASFPVPFSPAECWAIGRSIAEYTHRRFSLEGFSAVQVACGRKGGTAKGEAYEDKRLMVLCMLENGYSQKVTAAMLNVHRNAIRNWAMHK